MGGDRAAADRAAIYGRATRRRATGRQGDRATGRQGDRATGRRRRQGGGQGTFVPIIIYIYFIREYETIEANAENEPIIQQKIRAQMQKPKSGPAAKQHFSFLGQPRTPTHVNDLFIQPTLLIRRPLFRGAPRLRT